MLKVCVCVKCFCRFKYAGKTEEVGVMHTKAEKGGKNMENCDNNRPCPCTYDCPRHGKCCACVAHHRDHNEGVPGCFFSTEAEATYDRSIEALCRDKGIL